MGIKVTVSGSVATRVWDVEAMRLFAHVTRGAVTERTFHRGKGDDGATMRAYSTRPMRLYKRSQTGRRLAPKGGVAFPWVRGPRKPGGGHDRSKVGQEAGRFYSDGYAEFKRASRKGIGNEAGPGAEVDLVLSGQLARSLRVVRVSRYQATIAITGNARRYGHAVDAIRPFMDLSPEDVRDLQDDFATAVSGAAERSARGAR